MKIEIDIDNFINYMVKSSCFEILANFNKQHIIPQNFITKDLYSDILLNTNIQKSIEDLKKIASKMQVPYSTC